MMSTLLGVGLAVTLRDNFSSPAMRISAQSKELKNALRTLAAAQSSYFRTLSMTSTTFASVAYGLGRIISSAAKYKYEMVSVGAVTQATTGQLKAMDKQALQLSNDTIFQAQEIASAMKFMGMAGLNAKQIMGSMPSVVNLAGATDTQLGGKGGAADIMTNIMHTFGLAESETSKVADLLTAATVKANLNINDLGESLKYVGATSRNLQIPLKDTAAAIMLISNSGIQGSMAGVALENAMRYFTRAIGPNATKKQAATMKALGFTMHDFVDEAGNMIPLEQVFGKLHDRMKGISSMARAPMMVDLFGVRGQRAGSKLVDDPTTLKKFREELANSGGLAQSIMDKRMDSLQGHIWRVRDSLKSLGIHFTESITPLLKTILGPLNQILIFLGKILDTKFGKVFIGPAIAMFLVWKTVTLVLKLAVQGLNVGLAKNRVLAVEAGMSGVSAMNNFTAATTRATMAQQAFNGAQMRGAAISKFARVTQVPGMFPMVHMNRGKGAPPGTVEGKKILGGVVNYNPRTGKAVNTGGAYGAPEKVGKNWIVSTPTGEQKFGSRTKARMYYENRIQNVSKPMRNPSVPEGSRGSWFVTTPGGYKKDFSSEKKALRGVSKANTALGIGSKVGKAAGFLRFLGPIARIIGRLFAFLTGPWGMAIMAILTFLPGIIDLVKGWFGESASKQDKQTELLNALVEQDRQIMDGAVVRGAMRFLENNTPEIRNLQTIQNNNTLDRAEKQAALEDSASKLGYDSSVNQDKKTNSVVVNVTIPGEQLTSTIRAVSGEVVDAKFDKELNN